MYEIKYRKPEEMKDSGVEWLGRIPREWEVKKLKYLICKNDGGVWGDEPTNEINIPVFRSTEITIDGKWTINEIAYRRISFYDVLKYRLKTGDLLVTKSSGSPEHIGKTGIVTKEIAEKNAVYSNFMQRIKLRKGYSSKLVYYLMNNKLIRKQVEFFGTTTTGLMNLNGSLINELTIAICDSCEQKKIANFLDIKTAQFDSIILKKEKLIEKLEEAKKSLISEVVTGKVKIVDGQMVQRKPEEMKDSGVEWLWMIPKEWEVKKLKYLANKIGSGKTPRGGSEIYVEEGIPFLRSQNVYNDGLRFEDVVFINEKTNHEMSNTKVKYNDILLNITGASIGRCAMFLSKEKEANVNQHVCIIRLKKDIKNEKFYLFAIQSKLVQEQILSQQIGSSREGLNFEQIANFLLIIPRIDKEKEEIVAFLNKKDFNINITINKIQIQIQKLKEAKQALISEAVTGKIDLRDWEIIEEGGV